MDGASIVRYIAETFPDTDILTAGSGTFFSCDPKKHWPNLATLVTSDEYDTVSNLNRPDAYRFNIGVSRATFESVVGSTRDAFVCAAAALAVLLLGRMLAGRPRGS